MCSPLQAFLAMVDWRFKAIYHYARLLAYITISSLFYVSGVAAHLLDLQQALAISVGVVVIAAVILPLNKIIVFNSKISSYVISKAQNQPVWIKYFFMGLANGFLPCGLVYIMAVQSIIVNGYFESIIMVTVFMISTLPALLASQYLFRIVEFGKGYLKHLKPILIVAIGLLLIFRAIFQYSNDQGHYQTKICVSTVPSK